MHHGLLCILEKTFSFGINKKDTDYMGYGRAGIGKWESSLFFRRVLSKCYCAYRNESIIECIEKFENRNRHVETKTTSLKLEENELDC